MPVFTRFGVWDKEVRDFIETLSTQESLRDRAVAINEWFYSDGFAIFTKHQGDMNDVFIKEEVELTKKRPHVSYTVEDIDNHIKTLREYFAYVMARKEAKDSTQVTSPLRALSSFQERTERQVQMFQAANSNPAEKPSITMK